MKLSSLLVALDLFYYAHEHAKLEASSLNIFSNSAQTIVYVQDFSAAQNQRFYWEAKPFTASSNFSLGFFGNIYVQH
jgi:hypothetical protein